MNSIYKKVKDHYDQKTLFKALVRKAKVPLYRLYNSTAWKYPVHYVDIKNIYKHGFMSPRYAEQIWVNPKKISKVLAIDYVTELTGIEFMKHRNASAMVVEDWPSEHSDMISSVDDLPEVRFCIDHWVNGIGWEDTGAYTHMLTMIQQLGSPFNGCLTYDDVLERYRKLDQFFEAVKKESRLRPAVEVRRNNFRERGGVYVHVGPQGELFFGGGGRHRFTMSRILGFDIIPAQIGIVHRSAIPYVPKLRNRDN